MSEHHVKIGRKGGKSCVRNHGKEYMRELGRRGGKKTAEEYDMAFIGRLGAEKSAEVRKAKAQEKTE